MWEATGRYDHGDRMWDAISRDDLNHRMWEAIGRNAWPLPAIQPGYTDNWRNPLDFLSLRGAFYYPRALYSPGHAMLDISKGAIKEPQIYRRDRQQTLLMTESGGFQFIKGNLNIWDGNGVLLDPPRMKLLRWMEAVGGVSMTLDVPLFAIGENHPWARSFADCLRFSNENLYFFDKHKSNTIPFINVVHGRTTQEAREWYNTVKWFDCVGWAFGGHLSIDLRSALAQIIYMRSDGRFKNKYFLHFLGRGSAFAGICLSQIQKSLGEPIRVTYDNASAFLMGGGFAKVTSRLKTDGPYKPLIEERRSMSRKVALDYLTYDELMGYNVFMQLLMVEENYLAWEQGRISPRLQDVCSAIDSILASANPYAELSKLGPMLPKLNIR